MAVTQSYSTDEETDRRLTEMFNADQRTRSNFITWLINKEWSDRHPLTIREWVDQSPTPVEQS